MKRKFLYLLLTLCLLGQCLPAFAAQAPVLERIAFSGATIVGQFKSDVYQYQLVLDNAAVSPKLKSYKVQGEGNLFVTYDTDSIALCSCSPQSQRLEPNISPVAQEECTRTRIGSSCSHVPLNRATCSRPLDF